MLCILVLVGIFQTITAADSTSTIVCTGTNGGVVEVRSTWGALCKASAFENGVSKQVDFAVFGLAISGNNGNIVNVNPASGEKSSFDFQVSVKDTTGPFQITNILGAPPVEFTVIDIPTNMSSMVCDNVKNVDEQIKCTLTPRDFAGQQIYAEAKIFSMTGIDINLYAQSGMISWTSLSPSVGNEFIVLGTFPYSSVFGVTNGVTSQVEKVAAIAAPDGSTTMTCVPTLVTTNDSPRCTINARRNNVSIVTNYSSFVISGGNIGSLYGKVRPDGSAFIELGSLFSFDFIVGNTINSISFANTGEFALSNNVSDVPAYVTVVADPDSTSTLTCASNTVVAGGQLNCISTPKLQGTQIFAQTTVWVLSVEDKLGQQGGALGSFSSITPIPAGSSFQWTLTANPIIPNHTFPFDITLNDGRSSIFEAKMIAPELPDGTSTMTCAPLSLTVGEQTVCTITARKMNVSVVSASNAFSLSDSANGGQFSPIQPLAGKVFTFSYTPTSQGSIPLLNGRSPSPVILDVSQATTKVPTPAAAPSAPSPSTPTVPSSPTAKVPSAPLPTPASSPTVPAKAPTGSQAAANDNGGIGAGAIVGILLVVVVLLSGGGFFLYRRHKRSQVNHLHIVDEVGEYTAPRV